jgi:hypothetical protein
VVGGGSAGLNGGDPEKAYWNMAAATATTTITSKMVIIRTTACLGLNSHLHMSQDESQFSRSEYHFLVYFSA